MISIEEKKKYLTENHDSLVEAINHDYADLIDYTFKATGIDTTTATALEVIDCAKNAYLTSKEILNDDINYIVEGRAYYITHKDTIIDREEATVEVIYEAVKDAVGFDFYGVNVDELEANAEKFLRTLAAHIVFFDEICDCKDLDVSLKDGTYSRLYVEPNFDKTVWQVVGSFRNSKMNGCVSIAYYSTEKEARDAMKWMKKVFIPSVEMPNIA